MFETWNFKTRKINIFHKQWNNFIFFNFYLTYNFNLDLIYNFIRFR